MIETAGGFVDGSRTSVFELINPRRFEVLLKLIGASVADGRISGRSRRIIARPSLFGVHSFGIAHQEDGRLDTIREQRLPAAALAVPIEVG